MLSLRSSLVGEQGTGRRPGSSATSATRETIDHRLVRLIVFAADKPADVVLL